MEPRLMRKGLAPVRAETRSGSGRSPQARSRKGCALKPRLQPTTGRE
jgi:hypothetical protein